MATNEIQGSQLLHEFSFDDGVTWKVMVCAQGGKVNSKANITNESTKCGPIPGIGIPDWTMSGDAVANLAPTASECSLNDVMAAVQNSLPTYSRIQSPPHGAVQIGEEYYRLGLGYFTSADEDISNGSVVKFSWEFSGVGVLAWTKILGFYTQPLTPVALDEGDTLSLTVLPKGGEPPYTYQWKKGGVDIAGATNQNYVKANVLAADSATYTVVVTDDAAATATSAGSVVTVTP